MQIVPYFMTGYESVTKAAEEASPEFRARGFFRAIWAAIIVGFVFYMVVIAAVGFVAPWKQIIGTPFMTAVAFEHAIGSRWIVSVILATALLSLFKVFNGNLVAATRLVFAMSRRGLLASRLDYVHPTFLTPSTAVVWVGVATMFCACLGSAILVPISEVGSLASAVGWTAACLAYLRLMSSKNRGFVGVSAEAMPGLNLVRDKIVGGCGALVGLAMIGMKLLPVVPGHFSGWEWLTLVVWLGLGVAIGRPLGQSVHKQSAQIGHSGQVS